MPEKHPRASTIGSQLLDGHRFPWLANPGNPAMHEPPCIMGETQAPITLIKPGGGGERGDREGNTSV